MTASLGFATVGVFLIAFGVFAWLNPQFNFLNDFVSKLGAVGEPLAVIWNVVGFGVVGFLFAAFGVSLGITLRDRLAGICLVIAGLGFALAATPTELSAAASPLSRVHYASVCLALAGWCFALARLGYVNWNDPWMQPTANAAALLALAPMIGVAGRVSSEPIAHRLVLIVALSWLTLVSVRLWVTPSGSPSSRVPSSACRS